MAVMALLALALGATSGPAQATPPFYFVQTYISQLAMFEDIRKEGEGDTAGSADATKTELACVHSTARYDLEVTGDIRQLDSMRISVGFKGAHLETVPHTIADLYRARQPVMRQIGQICAAFLEGPKPGVDYKALLTSMTRLRAKLEYLNQTSFAGTALVFSTLISDRADKEGHASHLVIGCDQRQSLVQQIDRSFGKALDNPNPPSDVAQAKLIRDKLLEFKCADEPR